MAIHYIIPTKVRTVEERKRTVSVLKKRNLDGSEEIVTEEENLGWYVCFENSWESNFLGMVRPELEVGQEVEIVIRPVRKPCKP